MSAEMIHRLRQQKDAFFKGHPQSPLTPEQKAHFQGLEYYDYDPNLDLEIEVTPFEQKVNVQLQTTTGEMRWYLRYGEFRFEVDGSEGRLTIYQAPHGFFLPVVDANAGIETYGAGRYLEPEQIDESTFHIDLNQLYNPFCVYGDGWSCPITPAENRLSIALRAGEKIPTGDWLNL